MCTKDAVNLCWEIFFVAITSKEEGWIKEENEWLEVCRLICHGLHFLEISSKDSFYIIFLFSSILLYVFSILRRLLTELGKENSSMFIRWTYYWKRIYHLLDLNHPTETFLCYIFLFQPIKNQCTEFPFKVRSQTWWPMIS